MLKKIYAIIIITAIVLFYPLVILAGSQDGYVEHLRELICSQGSSSYDADVPEMITGLNLTVLPGNERILSWNRPGDNVGGVEYDIYRNGFMVGSTIHPLFRDIGTGTNPDYCYYVLAYDAAGKMNSISNLACSPTTNETGEDTPDRCYSGIQYEISPNGDFGNAMNIFCGITYYGNKAEGPSPDGFYDFDEYDVFKIYAISNIMNITLGHDTPYSRHSDFVVQVYDDSLRLVTWISSDNGVDSTRTFGVERGRYYFIRISLWYWVGPEYYYKLTVLM